MLPADVKKKCKTKKYQIQIFIFIFKQEIVGDKMEKNKAEMKEKKDQAKEEYHDTKADIKSN